MNHDHLIDIAPIEDVKGWCEQALTRAFIAERDFDTKMSFASSLGELLLMNDGIDVTPIEDRV